MTHFQNLDLRIGQIIGIEEHPNADKLYILKVDLGRIKQDLQLVAGLKPYYKEDELINKKIVVLKNLEPAVFRGVESQGMLLAASDRVNNKVSILIAKKSQPGANVFVEKTDEKPKEKISFDDWKKVKLITRGKKVYFEDKVLKTDKEDISLDRSIENAVVK